MQAWIGINDVSVKQSPAGQDIVSFYTFASDDTTLEVVTRLNPADQFSVAPVSAWQRVTLGELRAWLKDRAAAAEKAVADAALLAAMTSPGAKVEAPADLPPTATDAAVPGFSDVPAAVVLPTEGFLRSIGETVPPAPSVTPAVAPIADDPPSDATARVTRTPHGGDHVTGVGIQTPAPSFPSASAGDDDIPF